MIAQIQRLKIVWVGSVHSASRYFVGPILHWGVKPKSSSALNCADETAHCRYNRHQEQQAKPYRFARSGAIFAVSVPLGTADFVTVVSARTPILSGR
jgi:hypothetical protein